MNPTAKKLMLRKQSMLTHARLMEILHYDPASGVFTWRINIGGRLRVGKVAGWLDRKGYRRISINCKDYAGHRLAWFYVHGKWPHAEIDHINCIKEENRIENLREATNLQNTHNLKIYKNNKSGFKGVYFHKGHKKYTAQINCGNTKHFLGYFATAEAAHEAYCAAAAKEHGEFANFGDGPAHIFPTSAALTIYQG